MESCEEPWVKNGDHCYYWSMMEANWTQAEDYCRSGGGHLASVNSNATNEFILRELNKRSNSQLWIGGTDKGEQGSWNWTDCSPWDFEYWAEKQPSHHKRDDCVRYSKKITKGSTPKWNDWKCDHKHCFLCSQKLCLGEICSSFRMSVFSSTYHFRIKDPFYNPFESNYYSNRHWYPHYLFTSM